MILRQAWIKVTSFVKDETSVWLQMTAASLNTAHFLYNVDFSKQNSSPNELTTDSQESCWRSVSRETKALDAGLGEHRRGASETYGVPPAECSRTHGSNQK